MELREQQHHFRECEARVERKHLRELLVRLFVPPEKHENRAAILPRLDEIGLQRNGAAIARGYHLEDAANCRLVAPGDLPALEQAVTGVLDDPGLAAGLGSNARETVESHLTWRRYANEMCQLLVAAADGPTASA